MSAGSFMCWSKYKAFFMGAYYSALNWSLSSSSQELLKEKENLKNTKEIDKRMLRKY
jgi:hypothetical protein